MDIGLRKLRLEDLDQYKYWKQAHHSYHNLNGPYFAKKTSEELNEEIQNLKHAFKNGNDDPLPKKMIITNTQDELLGEVSWYWKSEETNWKEIGIVIFDENNWKKGIGKKAFKQWIDQMFKLNIELVRIGLTTWSGNFGMIKLSEQLGLKKEAEYRKARIVDGEYYASISYGVLREEWEFNHSKPA